MDSTSRRRLPESVTLLSTRVTVDAPLSRECRKLQRVQNAAARIVCQVPRREYHSAELLKDLHWYLPVRGRVDYKIAVLCYKAVKLQQPSCLTGLLSSYRQSRVLRSSSSDLLSTQSS